MVQPRIDTQYLLDSAAIRDVHERYFQAVDRGDADAVRACFSADVRATYHNRPVMQGLDTMMNATILPFFQKLGAGQTKISTHFIGNFRIEQLEGDVAETETYAIAVHIRAGTPADLAVIMSLRYLDQLARAAHGWRITERVQTMDWSCELPAASAMTLAQRVMHLGSLGHQMGDFGAS